VDNQHDVFEARPGPSAGRDALLARVDALALAAVIALNEAHGRLVNAGAVTRPPPSDRWYQLIAQFTESEHVADVKQQERRLCVGAAAFLAAEASHLEDHCAALSDDAGQADVREHLSAIAALVRDAVDALLKRSDLPQEPATAASWTSTPTLRPHVAMRGRDGRPWFLAAALTVLVVAYGLVGQSITSFSHPERVIVLFFLIFPALVVLKWYLQVRQRDRFINFLRTPQRSAGWFNDITRQSTLLDVRAAALGELLRRIRLVASNVAAERQVCESRGFFTAASKLDSLGRLLHDASESTENLAELVTDASEEARRFTASCRRDLYEACSEYVRLPLVLDPERIDTVIDNLVLVLRLTVEVAVDIPLHIRGEESNISTVPVGEIAAEVESIFREFRGNSRSLKHECRSMLRAFDSLHRVVTNSSIATLKLGAASRMTARVAVAASVWAQPTARRPAVRTAFMRAASASRDRSLVLIGKATTAAINRGQRSRGE
jgi:signal transduction histidine kinase